MNSASNNIVTHPAQHEKVYVQIGGAVAPGALLHVVGSRSAAVRLATVVSALRSHHLPQAIAHVNAAGRGLEEIFDQDGVPRTQALVSEWLDSESGRTARVLEAAEKALLDARPQAVVLTGDSAATFAFALAASKLGIEVVRIGAGLRTGDFSQPEEINRVLTDRLADALFTDGHDAGDALEAEGIEHGRITPVGNSAIDLLRRFEREAREAASWRRFGVSSGRYVLVTLHRPENVSDELRMTAVADALATLAERIPVVMPIHPVTRAQVEPFGTIERLQAAGVHVSGPLGYIDFLSLQQAAGAILTDSGGVQEEASALGVRCYTLRRATERIFTLTHGTNVLLGDDPAEIAEVRLDDRPPVPSAIPLWDGNAGERIAAELSRRFTLELAS